MAPGCCAVVLPATSHRNPGSTSTSVELAVQVERHEELTWHAHVRSGLTVISRFSNDLHVLCLTHEGAVPAVVTCHAADLPLASSTTALRVWLGDAWSVPLSLGHPFGWKVIVFATAPRKCHPSLRIH